MQLLKNYCIVNFQPNLFGKRNFINGALGKKGFTIGRLVHVPPQCGELYFMRVMLNHVKGPKCFEDIRTVNRFVHPTFREACYALGLIGDDREYIAIINEAVIDWGPLLPEKFVRDVIILWHFVYAERVLGRNLAIAIDDILHRQRTILSNQDNIATFLTTFTDFTDEELQNYALIDIENSLQINGSSLRRFEGMPFPDMSATTHHRNSLVMDALSYDRQSLSEEHEIQLSSMTDEQRLVYNEVMEAALNNKGGVFFVYGYGGTGKTFLWRALCACFRSKGDIVVAVASSGIAATLIPGGVTAHSRFGISINVTEDSICSRIKPGSDLAELLIHAKLIIWDEAPMTHRHCFEALDKSLKDVMCVLDVGNAEVPFGGKVVVFGGDFRQTLPVVSKGSRADVVAASLCSSYLWSFCKVLRLTKNMRLQAGSSTDNVEELRKFSEWLLEIGDGIAKDERIYLSSDEVCSDDRGTCGGDIHSIEFLNKIKCAGLRITIEVEGRCYGDASAKH
ncbi:uncharacterized protein LOC141595171 [Silene latifolia]|uniref:uncharacterized protein LOC141595171 n=1 Tax=Silene latifolia TaxID=37657 RepID=UPI003D76E5BA